MTVSWEETLERTMRGHVRKVKQVVSAVLEEFAPASAKMLLQSVQSTAKAEESVDKTLMKSLVECYNNENHWSARRQILSIMADEVSSSLKIWIPGVTRCRFNVARHFIAAWARFFRSC